jgi:hypothetical protein
MAYFNSRNVAAIAICSALWGVLNSIFSPIFFQTFGLPFLCDLIGFSVLVIAAWWIRKFGAITIIGLIATLINFALNGGIFFLGFTAAAIFFDVATRVIGFDNAFKKSAYIAVSMMAVAVASAGLAGYVIGSLFMAGPVLVSWGGVVGWAGLHIVGGVIGGVIGVFLIVALAARNVTPNGTFTQPKQKMDTNE